MSNIEHRSDAATITRGGHRDWSLESTGQGVRLEKFDAQVDEYMPMDVFVDPLTIRKQFSASSIRGSRSEIH